MPPPVERPEFRELEKSVNTMAQNIATMQAQIAAIQANIATLVSRAEFTPVKMIAYGLATTVLSSVLMAILAKVIMK